MDELDVGRRHIPEMRDVVTSTNVFAHVEATRAGAGVGLLPTFLAAPHHDLIRLLGDEVHITLDHWLVAVGHALAAPRLVRRLVTFSSLTI